MKTVHYIICFFLALTSISVGQNYVEIGTGTVSNTMPVYSYWNYSWSSLIYHSDDLGAAKTITKIGLNCINGPKTVTNQKVYFKLVSNDIFGAANYEDPVNTGYTLAFQGDLTFQTGWNEITLLTPIPYDGVQNIAIHWENRWGTSYGPIFNSTTSAINNNKNCGNDVNFPPPSQTGYLNPYPGSLTNMRFYYAGTGPATPTNPIPADNSTIVSVSTALSWELGANTTSYDLYFGTDAQNLSMVVNNAPAGAGIYSYIPPSLLSDSTWHYWKVVARNGSVTETSPVWKFKTEYVIDEFPYNEGFEDSLVFFTYPVVSAWSINPDVSWYQYNVNSHSGQLCAKSSWYTYSTQAILRSPKVLLPPQHSISYYWQNSNINKVAGHDTTFFEVSTNGGLSWTVVDYLAPASPNTTYLQRVHDLNAYAGNNFFFRFRHHTDTTSSAANIYLDDISIFQSSTTPTLLVTPANQNVTAPAGNTQFSVVSNSSWTAASIQTWCTVTPAGSGNGNILANYSENTTGSERIAEIVVSATGLPSVTVTVTQSPNTNFLIVNPANQNVSSNSGNTTFTVTTNSSWTASSDQSWCTVTPSGTGNAVLQADYESNTTFAARVAVISVVVPGLSAVNVTVTQDAASPFLNVTPSNQNVDYQPGTTNFTVSSNLSWTAVSNSGWCAVTPSGNGNGTLFATYSENTMAGMRVAEITVSANGINDVIVTVTQTGPLPVLSVAPASQTVNYPAGMTSYAVNTNTAWTAESDADWCFPTSSGTGTSIMNATYLQNLTQNERIANITVQGNDVDPVIVQLIQLPFTVGISDPLLSEIKVFPNPGKGDLTIYSNASETKPIIAEILNSNGICVYKKTLQETGSHLHLHSFPKGTYIIRFIGADMKTHLQKIIIE